MKIYLVGGAVRDKILGKRPRDKDYVVIGADEKSFLERFPRAKRVGKKIPVFIYKGKEFTLSPHKSIEDDLWDRDLTINAIAMDEDGKIYTLPDTMKDINNKILRPVKEENFFKDPLRIYRVARFVSHMPDYTLHDTLIQLIIKVGKEAELLKKISAERINAEIVKAMEGVKPGNFLEVLDLTDAFGIWFEEFKNLKNRSMLAHTIEVMDRASGCVDAVWMAMCHELKTEEFKIFVKKLKFSNRFKFEGLIAIDWHSKAKRYPDMDDIEKVELLESLDRKRLVKEFFRFILADSSKDYYSQAQKELEKIKSVHLPEKYRNLGALSGKILKELKAKKLKEERSHE